MIGARHFFRSTVEVAVIHLQEDSMRSLRTISTCLILALNSVGCAQDADVAARSSAGGSGAIDDATGGTGVSTGGTGVSTGGSRAAAGGSTGFDLVRSVLAADATPNISDADYAAFISSANEFGLELMQEVANTKALDKTKNAVFSPVSAMMALAMVYGGAEDRMADAMKVALHDELAPEQYHFAQNRLMRELRGFAHEGTDMAGNLQRVEVTPANSLWLDKAVSPKNAYIDLMGEQYDTGLYRVDFLHAPETARLAINNWVEDRTRDKIRELLLPADVTNNTAMVLVNALYLYASWESLFDVGHTVDAEFATLAGGTVTTSMMRQSDTVPYRDLGDVQVAQIPYVNGDLHLTLVLPKEGQFETVRQAVSNDWLFTTTSGLTPTYVSLGLPKFTIETAQIPLMPALQNLGLFDGGKAITGIANGDLVLSNVIQKAFIGTDESGTEAAAATAVLAEVSIKPEPVPFTLNRPFLYFIQAENGLVLFAGQVTDPTATN